MPNQDLTGTDFDGVTAAYADYSGAKIVGTVLTDSSFPYVTFDNALISVRGGAYFEYEAKITRLERLASILCKPPHRTTLGLPPRQGARALALASWSHASAAARCGLVSSYACVRTRTADDQP